MDFLERLALAHQRHEGFYPGSISFRLNNPGALRYRGYHKDFYGAEKGDYGFAKFPTYRHGFKALKDDLEAKICGRSSHIDYSKNPTFLDYIKIYAPREDNNDPNSYVQSLIRQLSEYKLSEDTPLSEIANFIDSKPSREFPFRRRVIPPKNIKTLRRGLKRAMRRGLTVVANGIMRAEDRLL